MVGDPAVETEKVLPDAAGLVGESTGGKVGDAQNIGAVDVGVSPRETNDETSVTIVPDSDEMIDRPVEMLELVLESDGAGDMPRSDPDWLEEPERDPRGGGRAGGGGFTRVLLVLEDLFDKEDGVGEGEGDGEGEEEDGGKGGRFEGEDGLGLL